jgi:hypothetical protein
MGRSDAEDEMEMRRLKDDDEDQSEPEKVVQRTLYTRVSVLLIWVQFLGQIVLNLIASIEVFSTGVSQSILIVQAILALLRMVVIWGMFSYVIVGRDCVYVPIYLLLLVLVLGSGVGEVSVLYLVAEQASDGLAPSVNQTGHLVNGLLHD